MELGTLRISAPYRDLAEEIGLQQVADSLLDLFRAQAHGAHPNWRLRDNILYWVMAQGDCLVVSESLRNELL